METISFLLFWQTFLQWFIMAIGIYSLAIFAIMEFAVDHLQPRGANGKLRIKKDGFVMQRLYHGNFISNEENRYPKSICQMYRGLWSGTAYCAFAYTLICAGYIMVHTIAFLFGYVPKKWSNPREGFHPKERFGEDGGRRWVAPYKIIAPAVIVYCHKLIFAGISLVLSPGYFEPKTIIFLKILPGIMGVAGLFLFIAFFSDLKKWLENSPTWEYLKGLKQKVCTELEIV